MENKERGYTNKIIFATVLVGVVILGGIFYSIKATNNLTASEGNKVIPFVPNTIKNIKIGVAIASPSGWVVLSGDDFYGKGNDLYDDDEYLRIQKTLPEGGELVVSISNRSAFQYEFSRDDIPTFYKTQIGTYLDNEAYFSNFDGCASEGASKTDCYIKTIDIIVGPIKSKKPTYGDIGEGIYADILEITYGVSRTFDTQTEAQESSVSGESRKTFENYAEEFEEILGSIELIN